MRSFPVPVRTVVESRSGEECRIRQVVALKHSRGGATVWEVGGVMGADERVEPSMLGSEREQLAGFLDYLRATVAWKCRGLTDEQARRALLPSELTTMAGLVGHLCYVENYWFGVVLAGADDPWREAMTLDRDAEFRAALDVPLAVLVADYQRQCAHSRRIAEGMTLDRRVPFRGEREVSLRYVLIHLIEETARHAGHLDVLRELLDGRTGE